MVAVQEEEVGVEVEWEVTAPDPGLVGTAFAPVVELKSHTRSLLPATT